MNLSKSTKLIKILDGAATNTTTLTSSTIDMAGFEGVRIFGQIATVNAGNYVKAREGAASNMSDAADLAGTKLVPGTNGNSFDLDIYKPLKRYIDVQIVRGGATTVTGDVYALLYEARKAPVSQGATIESELHVSPAEGTA